MTNSVKKQLFKNVGSITGIRFFSQVITIISNIFLARLLNPADFGIFGLSLSIVGIVTIFGEMGIGQAVIQKKTEEEDTLFYTGFFINLAISIILFPVLVLFAAPIGADIYDNSDIKYVIIFLSFLIVLDTLRFIPRMRITKENKLTKLFWPNILESLSYSIVAVLMATIGFKYWSFVFAKIISSITAIVVFYFSYPWKLRFIFNWKIGKDLLHFGKFLLLNNLITLPRAQIDKLVIGKYLDLASVGHFTFAQHWGGIISLEFGGIINKVLYPVNVLYQDKIKKLEQIHLQAIKYITLIAFPISFGFILVAPEIIQTILGPKWMPSLIPLQIFSLFGLVDTINRRGMVFVALGKPQYQFFSTAIYGMILCVTIFPLTQNIGIIGTAIAHLISLIPSHFLFSFWLLEKYYKFDIKNIFKKFIIPLASSLVMIACVIIFKTFMYKAGLGKISVLLGSVLLGVIIYSLCLFLFMKAEIFTFVKILVMPNLTLSEKAKKLILVL